MAPPAEPQRTCTGCGRKRGKRELIRIVGGPDGSPVPDLKGRLPSRGAYVCPSRSCIEQAASGRLRYALRLPSSRPVDGDALVDVVSRQYMDRALSLLGLAQKGGNLVSGTNLVEGELRRNSPGGGLGLVASDASEDVTAGVRKRMEFLGLPVAVFATRDMMGNAIGKSPRSILLVTDDGIATEIRKTIDRYRSVCG